MNTRKHVFKLFILVSFPLELHMVFHASFYGSFEDSIAHPDGLTVLAFLFSVSKII